MKIRYTRSGGLPNITTSVEIDSETLPPETAEQFKKLISNARVFQQKATGGKTIPDDLHHDLEILDAGRSHSIHRCDSECAPELLHLFDRLHQEALTKIRLRRKSSGQTS